MQIGRLAAQVFDEIIIRLDKDLRGKTADSIIGLLQKGIADHQKPVKVIPCEKEAIRYAVANARPGDLIVDCSEAVTDAIRTVEECLTSERTASGQPDSVQAFEAEIMT
jgi:cyanophycin synthetase